MQLSALEIWFEGHLRSRLMIKITLNYSDAFYVCTLVTKTRRILLSLQWIIKTLSLESHFFALFLGLGIYDISLRQSCSSKRIKQNQILFDCRNKKKTFKMEVGGGVQTNRQNRQMKMYYSNQHWIYVYLTEKVVVYKDFLSEMTFIFSQLN